MASTQSRLRRLAAVAIGTSLTVGSLIGGHTVQATSSAIIVPEVLSGSSINGYRTHIVKLTNQHRANAGVRLLSTSPALTNACQAHANDMASMRKLTHTGSNGSNGGTRATRYGFPWTSWGENIAAGQTSSRQVVNAWMASSAHRVNILNSRFTRIGIGVQQASNGTIYYCMLLASA